MHGTFDGKPGQADDSACTRSGRLTCRHCLEQTGHSKKASLALGFGECHVTETGVPSIQTCGVSRRMSTGLVRAWLPTLDCCDPLALTQRTFLSEAVFGSQSWWAINEVLGANDRQQQGRTRE